jgi:hypothetical protein
MPAFLRILYVGFVLLVIHIDHIQRAGILTGSASGAEFFIDDWWHDRQSFPSDVGDLLRTKR